MYIFLFSSFVWKINLKTDLKTWEMLCKWDWLKSFVCFPSSPIALRLQSSPQLWALLWLSNTKHILGAGSLRPDPVGCEKGAQILASNYPPDYLSHEVNVSVLSVLPLCSGSSAWIQMLHLLLQLLWIAKLSWVCEGPGPVMWLLSELRRQGTANILNCRVQNSNHLLALRIYRFYFNDVKEQVNSE